MAEWQAAMSSREFAEWQVYASIQPFGEARADLRTATVAALLAEPNRDRKKRSKPYTVTEFVRFFRGEGARSNVPQQDRRAEPQQDRRAELWANLKAWAMRGKDGDS